MNANRRPSGNEESPEVISSTLPVYTNWKMPLLLKKKKTKPFVKWVCKSVRDRAGRGLRFIRNGEQDDETFKRFQERERGTELYDFIWNPWKQDGQERWGEVMKKGEEKKNVSGFFLAARKMNSTQNQNASELETKNLMIQRSGSGHLSQWWAAPFHVRY